MLSNTQLMTANLSIKDLMKPVGPGNYDLPVLTGQKQISSTKQSPPSFSISQRVDPNKKVVISKDHIQEIIGRDSPGVGSYTYDYNRLQRILSKSNMGGVTVNDNYSFTKEKKFFELTENLELKTNLPHFYNLDYKTKWENPVGGFTKDERFKYIKAEQELQERSPGPTTAQINRDFSLPKISSRKNINLSIRQKHKNSSALILEDSSRDRFIENRQIYFKELAKDRIGKDSPGFVYNTEQSESVLSKRNSSFSFGRDPRRVNELQKKDIYNPPIGTYDAVNLTLLKNRPTGGGFSKATRNFDLVGFSQRHKIYAGQKFF
eukprot:403340173